MSAVHLIMLHMGIKSGIVSKLKFNCERAYIGSGLILCLREILNVRWSDVFVFPLMSMKACTGSEQPRKSTCQKPEWYERGKRMDGGHTAE
jgi:hypothetical protein